jgi:NitT/TauT family transport system permease protein
MDGAMLEAAQTLGASRRQLVRNVILPGVLPDLYNDLRILLGWAWTYLIVAELIGAKSGITAYIAQQSRYFNFDLVFAAILVIGLLGLASDQVLQFVGRFIFPWQRKPVGIVSQMVWKGLTFVPRVLFGAGRAALASRRAGTGEAYVPSS